MAKRPIREIGEEVEREFLGLIPGSQRADCSKVGDVLVPIEGAMRLVEVKGSDREEGRRLTVNQIRPCKMTPCVWHQLGGVGWYVLSPVAAVCQGLKMRRGQHTENPLECMNLPLTKFKELAIRTRDAGELTEVLASVIKDADKLPQLKKALDEMLSAVGKVRDDYRERISTLIGDR